MIYDLYDLLSVKAFSHPSTITAAQIGNDSLRITVRGYGWWNDQPSTSNGNAVFAFSGISSGSIDIPVILYIEEDEALGDLEVIISEDIDWAKPTVFSLYCNQALPEPLVIYDIVERWVARSQGIKAVDDFLHGSERLSTFLTNANSNFFMLAQGPESLRTLLAKELERQGVRHQFKFSNGCSESRYLVRLAPKTWFFCESATLEPI